MAKRIDDVQVSFEVQDILVDHLNFDLMEVVYQWASGVVSFCVDFKNRIF